MDVFWGPAAHARATVVVVFDRWSIASHSSSGMVPDVVTREAQPYDFDKDRRRGPAEVSPAEAGFPLQPA